MGQHGSGPGTVWGRRVYAKRHARWGSSTVRLRHAGLVGLDEPLTPPTGRGAWRKRAFPKPFQARYRADPYVALIVFQERRDDVGQQPVPLSEPLRFGTELSDSSSADPGRIED